MATAPIADTDEGEIEAEAEAAEQSAPEINFEAEAAKMGWTPADKFKGDPAKHVDAETFYRRGREVLPILQAQNKTLLRRLEVAERAAKQAAEFFSKAEERAYNRALSEIRAEQEAAVESGDIAAHRAAAKRLDELEKPGKAVVEPAEPSIDAAEVLADWGRENKWYASNLIMRGYADAQADKLLKSGAEPGPEHLAKVTEMVRAKFPEEFEDVATEPKPRPRSPVAGSGNIPSRGAGKTFHDLPADAQAACDRWVKQGLIKDRAAYVRSYDFS